MLREHVHTCLSQAMRVSHEIEIGPRNRFVVPTQITSTPIIGPQGYVVGCKTTLTDISALKRAQEVLRFLGEASTILASSFDYPSTAAEAIRLAVPLMADVVILDIFDTAGVLQRIEVASADSRRARLTDAARNARPPRGARTPIGLGAGDARAAAARGVQAVGADRPTPAGSSTNRSSAPAGRGR